MKIIPVMVKIHKTANFSMKTETKKFKKIRAKITGIAKNISIMSAVYIRFSGTRPF